MTVDHVFPEDQGTGASEGDDADAANFGAHAQHDNLSDYIAGGLSFQNIDYTNLTFDVTAGKAFLKESSATTAQSGESRDRGVLFEVEVSARSGVSLTDNAVNEVFVDVDLSTDDSVTINVQTGGTTPQQPFLKIGEINTSTNSSNEDFNRAPEVTANSVSAPSTRNYLDLTGNDLRVGTGQSIEDGGGAKRVELDSGNTRLYDEGGSNIVWLASTSVIQERPSSGQPWKIRDLNGGFDAVKYTTSSSAPGTLELTKANLLMKNNDIKGVHHLTYEGIVDNLSPSASQGGTYLSDSSTGNGDDGDLVVETNDSAGSGDKVGVLFDYSAGSVSSERYKKDIRSLEADPYGILDVEAITYTSRDSNEKTAHGFIAEDLADWNERAVNWKTLSEDWAHDDYTEKYSYEVGDEVPNQPKEWPVIAAHHEIIRDLKQRIEELEAQVAA